MGDVTFYNGRYAGFVPHSARLERLWTGGRWLEGAVYFADGQFLLFSDIPNDRLLRWVEGCGVSEFRRPSGYSNGNTRDREGRLITCEHGNRRITRTELDGTVTVLVDSYKGHRLNSPNDVVVKSDGTIWFSDPPYGILTDYEGHKAASELDGCYVFRFDPANNELTIVADQFKRPNGLAFSPNEERLYVSETGRSDIPEGPPHIWVFDVVEGRRLERGQRFADMKQGSSDGLRIDTDGNVWTSAGNGVGCYTPGGELVLTIHVPERVSNLAFGGPKRNRLFITAGASLYSIYTGQNGSLRP
jgi:gluconolactonase